MALVKAPFSFGFTPTGFANWLDVVIVLSFTISYLPT